MIRCAAALLSLATAAPAGLAADDVVPELTATALDGTPFVLSEDLGGHELVVVLFLSTACPYATYFADEIRALDEAYRSRGVLFVGIYSNQFETEDDMREFAAEHGHSFRLVRDGRSRLADVLGARRTPEAFVVGRGRRLLYHGWVQSKLRSPDLERALEAALEGRPVRRARTKAFGCGIDRPRPR